MSEPSLKNKTIRGGRLECFLQGYNINTTFISQKYMSFFHSNDIDKSIILPFKESFSFAIFYK